MSRTHPAKSNPVIEVVMDPFHEKKRKKKTKNPVATAFQVAALGSARPMNPSTFGLHQHIVTAQDRFIAGLLAHMLDCSVEYPLPGVRNSGYEGMISHSYLPGPFVDPLTPVPAGDLWNRNPFTAAGFANTPSSSNVEEVGRYIVSHGRVQTTLKLNTGPTGECEYWLWFDPQDLRQPVKVLDMSNATSPVPHGSMFASDNDWTSSPYILNRNTSGGPFGASQEFEYVPHKAPPKVTVAEKVIDIETQNMYYMGGADLQVSWLNQSAYTQCALRVSGADNYTHRFVDDADDFGSSNNLGFTVPFRQGTGAMGQYSGSMWTTAYRTSSLASPTQIGTALNRNFLSCWNAGKTLVQLRVSSAQSFNQELSFSVTGNCWIGSAPCRLDQAGAMPYETLPFRLPSWVRLSRQAGVVISGSCASAEASLIESRFQAVLPKMEAFHPLEVAVSQSRSVPEAAAKVVEIAKSPSVVNSQSRPSGLFDSVKDFAAHALDGLTSIGRVVGPMLMRSPNLMGKALGGAASLIGLIPKISHGPKPLAITVD